MARVKRRLPPPNWLRAFEASARHLSFTGAARELHVTQSAVSQQVRLLEQYLQEPLFTRHPRRLELTDTGEAYLVSVHDAFERLARSTDELFGQRRQARVTLRTNAAFGAYWLAPRLQDFQIRHPEIEVRITLSVWSSETVWDAVSLEIRHGAGAWAGLSCERLTRDELFPVCAPSLLAGGRPLSTPIDLAHQELIQVLGNNEGWRPWLDAVGMADFEPGSGLQCDSSVVALEIAAAGGGVTIGPSSLTTPLVEAGRLVAPFQETVTAEDNYHLVSPEARVDSAAAAALRTWLLEQANAADG
ncbi:MAG: transcriptional regulator GcvA [Chromatiales bacterium]|jgi:LysR family transcriptional regulator, glycine cleavage system transcriptional activator|nr:transcriptional regulator GcvA [Chromatiales bacterium]